MSTEKTTPLRVLPNNAPSSKDGHEVTAPTGRYHQSIVPLRANLRIPSSVAKYMFRSASIKGPPKTTVPNLPLRCRQLHEYALVRFAGPECGEVP
mmetsp:Transcript_62078/g.166138  ORF Transcript_62078/g.166138 Transcript_62078/m.166138 type:complete len:95 (+) Transcript_62078:204-488(+)